MSTTETVSVAAGTWDIDAVHSDVSFAVRHMMVSKVVVTKQAPSMMEKKTTTTTTSETR